MIKQFKWEQPLTDEQRDLVASVYPKLWWIAKRSTPKQFRDNEYAVENSYERVLKVVLNAAKSYDGNRSSFETYSLSIAGKSNSSLWKNSSNGLVRSLSISQESDDEDRQNKGLSFIIDNKQNGSSIESKELAGLAMNALKKFNKEWHKIVKKRFEIPDNDYDRKKFAKKIGKSVDRINVIIRLSLEYMRNYLIELEGE